VKTLSLDTDPRAEAILIDGLRRMTGAQRLARVCALRETALALARVRLRETHGELSEHDERLRLATHWLDAGTLKGISAVTAARSRRDAPA
jgi:hypothetical protein